MSMQDPEFGDWIAVDSGADLESDAIEAPACRRSKGLAAPPPREIPPPISLLGRAEDQPWVMRRHLTSDGRLVIKEERRSLYVLTDRSDGRLLLSLVHVDDDGDAVEELEGDEELHGGDEEEEERGSTAAEVVEAEPIKYTCVGMEPCGGYVAVAPALMPPLPS